ncbi:MFS transporter [Rhodoblastus sp.]|uniref:MFS transporter n=1 Tax=Rhodoblastus sp. TaxID=1962975 RepID=UPI0026259445|nr:MFS transporter [Rhodoblastus sp.]
MKDKSQAHDAANGGARTKALRFVLLIGIVSLFGDFTYEGARSVTGPYLESLNASAAVVGVVAGLGELIGYGLRLASGRLADVSGRYWPMAIFGYMVQLLAVPALALAGSWPQAAALILLERVGKAIRNPPRDVMLSHAGAQMGGYGWAFGLREALDQFGAMVGPLVVAAVLAGGGSYREAFAVLVVPALITLALVGVARLLYPAPHEMEPHAPSARGDGLPRVFWVYLFGAALVAAGFADWSLIAFHLARTDAVSTQSIAIFYSVAMAVSGAGSLAMGRLFDRFGFAVLIGLTIVSSFFAPFAFFGGFGMALVGACLWGLGMGVHESIIPAAVAPMVAPQRRAYAFGLFAAGYGLFWFLGSAAIGFLYDRSIAAAVVFCLVAQFAALPPFIWVWRRQRAAS